MPLPFSFQQPQTVDENGDYVVVMPTIEPGNPEGESTTPEPMLSADVEFFLAKADTNEFMPVTGLIDHGKGNALWVDKYTGILEDNAAIELNMPPSRSGRDFYDVVCRATKGLNRWTNEKNLRLKYTNVQAVSPLLLQQYPQLTEFGCSQDYVAYNENPMEPRKPLSSEDLGLHRYAAGHLHLSYNTDLVPPFVMARWLDATIGLDSVFWDTQGKRRPLYGVAGLHRPTSYPNGSKGVEYRTLSNLWFLDNKKAHNIGVTIFNLVKTLQKDTAEAKNDYAKIPWEDINNAINTVDKKSAGNIKDYLMGGIELYSYITQNLGFNMGSGLSFQVEA